MVHATWVQRARVCEDISDGGSEMAPVRSQALQRQGNGETETSLTGRQTFTQRDGACRVTRLPSPCLQPVPPSSVEQTQVWLAVNEDGLCVLDVSMVGGAKASVQLRFPGLVSRRFTLCLHFPEHAVHVSLPVCGHLWRLP